VFSPAFISRHETFHDFFGGARVTCFGEPRQASDRKPKPTSECSTETKKARQKELERLCGTDLGRQLSEHIQKSALFRLRDDAPLAAAVISATALTARMAFKGSFFDYL
jgi:hypothetical protein